MTAAWRWVSVTERGRRGLGRGRLRPVGCRAPRPAPGEVHGKVLFRKGPPRPLPA